jgi:phosphoribosylanthranilate isomerase
MSRGLIKICGVTTPEDAAAAVELGADLLGINFFPGSPRCARPEDVPAIVEAIGEAMNVVAVLVQPSREELLGPAALTAAVPTIQWHARDHEPRPWLTKRLIPAFGVESNQDLQCIAEYLACCRDLGCVPTAILIDAVAQGLHGGTGKLAPWKLLADFDPGVPLILAGGLKPENVAEAIRTVRPAGVDVASGVEESPGRKSRDKMRRFIEAARAAFDRN